MSRPPAAVPGWLLAELAPTLRLATTLTVSPATAAALVADALVRDPSWGGLDPGGDPTPQLRTSVVRVFLRDRPTPAPDAVGLAALSPVARAATVLHDGEQLTIVEIATITDRPVRQVAADLAAESGRHDLEIAELRAAAPSPLQVPDRYLRAVRQLRREDGRRRGLIGAGVLVGALVVAGAVLLPAQLDRLVPPDTRSHGEWRFTHRVELADGWSIEQRLLTPETEQTVIRLPTTNGDPGHCTVTLTDQREPISRAADTHPVNIDGRDATYVDDPRLDPFVVWSYATGAFATVSCSRLVTPESLQLQVADAVVLRGDRIRLPFILTAIPAGYRVAFISLGATETERVSLGLTPDDPSAEPSLTVDYGADDVADRCLEPGGDVRSVSAADQRAEEVCLEATWSTDGPPTSGETSERALDAVTEQLRLADDLADPGTWFAATDLPG